MNILIRSLNGKTPRPEPGRILRRDGVAVLARPGEKPPPGFPGDIAPEAMLKDSRSVAAFRCGGGRYFAKLYKMRSFGHALAHTFRTPRAFICYAAAEALARVGFATPRPAAAAVRYRFGVIPIRQILLTEALPEDTRFLDREFAALNTEADALALLRELARFVGKLHTAGFLHGDLSLRNLYRSGNGFGVIDLDGLLRAPSPRRGAAAAELARLVSDAFRRFSGTPDRERWIAETLAAYREAGGAELRPADLLPTIRRLEKHQLHTPRRH